MLERWSVEDSQENRDRIAAADARLESWARWQASGSPDRLDYPRASPFVRVMKPQADEAQAGAQHLRSDLTCTDEEALQVDAVLADWKLHHRPWWKVARKEYLTAGPSEKKARELGVSRAEYRRQLDVLRLVLWRELYRPVALAPEYSMLSGKLAK